MKKLLSLIFCFTTAVAGNAQAPNYDFSAVNAEGITLYYKITDETNRKVGLSMKEGDQTYATLTQLIVPDKATDENGVEYDVVTILDPFKYYNTPYPALEELTLPKTLETLDWQPILGLKKLKNITLQALKSHFGIFFQSDGVPFEEIRLLMTTLPENTFTYFPYPIFNTNTPMDNTRVYVPVDHSYLYKNSESWEKNASDQKPVPYFEELTIGPNGYTTYYLENENFEVPTGCTAYIVTAVGAPTGATTPYPTAMVKAFSAGKIIPKKTGFILEGTPGAHVAYRANVSGTEEDVTGNLMVGTATEQELNGGGYKWYVFGKGNRGQGFYHQTGRGGNSISLKAHKAGLRLPESGVAPAKAFVIDFEEAKRNATTGIATITERLVSSEDHTPIYNMQGRRVQRPTRGIYIRGGKKIIIK